MKDPQERLHYSLLETDRLKLFLIRWMEATMHCTTPIILVINEI